MERYIVIMLIPDEPYLLYYCGMYKNEPTMYDIVGLVKQLPLEDAESIFNSINPINEEVTMCLIEWSKFAAIYQTTELTKEALIENSFKSK